MGMNTVTFEGKAFTDASEKAFDWDSYAGFLLEIPDELSRYGNTLAQITASKEKTPYTEYQKTQRIKQGQRVLVNGAFTSYKARDGRYVSRFLVEKLTLIGDADNGVQPEEAGQASLMAEENEEAKREANDEAQREAAKPRK
jgi:hypothetical protein